MTSFGQETFLEVNDAFLSLTGYSRAEVVGKTSGELEMWSSPEDLRKLGEMQRDEAGFRNLELSLRNKDGGVHTVLLSAVVIRLGGGEGYLKMCYDVTEQRRTQEQFYRAIQEVMSDTAEHENAVDMAVDGSGNIYMAYERGEYDYESLTHFNVVAKYTTNGTLLWQRTFPVGTPYGVTVSGSGSVYVVGTKGLARYTNSGSLIWSKAADNSRGVRSGEVVISGSSLYTRSVKTIRKYDGSGKQL